MEEAEILELYEVDYSDLVVLSCSTSTNDKMDSMVRSIMESVGPRGPGLLAITGVPNASKLRSQLLPLARHLALLQPQTRTRILKVHYYSIIYQCKCANVYFFFLLFIWNYKHSIASFVYHLNGHLN